jgi:CheY-like chemotaxis protein
MANVVRRQLIALVSSRTHLAPHGAQSPWREETTLPWGPAPIQPSHRSREQYVDAPRPDLILPDLNLPKHDGRQVQEQIKSDPQLKHIPVVLTNSSAEEDILRSHELHANAYLTKPVDLDQFILAIRQIDDFFVTVVKLPRH